MKKEKKEGEMERWHRAGVIRFTKDAIWAGHRMPNKDAYGGYANAY